MQIMYLNVSVMSPLLPSIKPQEGGEMIEVSYGSNQSLWYTSSLGYAHRSISKNRLHLQNPTTWEPQSKIPYAFNVSTKFPFSFNLAKSASNTYNESKEKIKQKQRRTFLWCSYISSHWCTRPKTPSNGNLLCMPIKMQKCNFGQD